MKPLPLVGATVWVGGTPAGWTELGALEFEGSREPVPAVVADAAVEVRNGVGQVALSYYPPQSLTAGLDVSAMRELFGTPSAAMTVVYEGRRPVPLHTGRLWGRRRVDHARALHLATWKRRRQRRHGIPAATVWTRVLIPRAREVSAAG